MVLTQGQQLSSVGRRADVCLLRVCKQILSFHYYQEEAGVKPTGIKAQLHTTLQILENQ